jgi:predicted dehydrogenase
MNCLIIGYGSIGKRHASILRDFGHHVRIVTRRNLKYFPVHDSIGEALERETFDYAVVSSETSDHYRCYSELVKSGFSGKVLVEKPVFSELPPVLPADKGNVFIGYNLRFHPVIRKIRELFIRKPLYSIHVYAGQYLPAWRPNSDYSKSYLASKARGGGVLKDLSHELDYVTWIAGDWRRMAAIGGKYSNLAIDSEDIFSLLMETENCPVISVQLNYLDIVTRREIIIHAQDVSVKADLIENTININGEITRYSSARNLTYALQHRAILEGNYSDLCTLNEGMNILKLIEAAVRASEQGKWIQNPDPIGK